MANGEVIIDVNADTSKYEDKVKGLGSKTESMMGKARAASTALLAGVAAVGVAVGGIAVNGIKLAGELEQNIGGASAVYGKYADELVNKSKTAYKEMGLSQSDYLQTANLMGSLFRGSGFEISDAMDMTSTAMQRAADVASIMGIDTSVAMESIAGAAKGNFTMMDNLGVAINDTSLNAYALEKGLGKTTKQMTNAEKVGLAMEMFLDRTSFATGNYAKENDTFAGSLTTLKANFANVSAQIGEKFLPILTDVFNFFNDFMANDPFGKLKELAPTFVIIGGAILGGLVPALVAMAAAAWAAVAPLIPFLAIGAALGAAVWLVVDALGGWSNALAALKSAWSTVWGYISPLVNTIKTFIVGTFNTIMSAISDNMGLIQATIQRVMKAIQASWAIAWDIIKAVIPPLWNAIKTAISGALSYIGGIIKAAMQLITGDWSGAWETMKETMSGLVKSLFEIAVNIGKAVWDGLKAAFKGIGSLLKDTGKAIIQGLWDGMVAIWNKVKSWVTGIADWIKQNKGPISYDKKLLIKNGEAIMGGFSKGLANGWSDVQSQIGSYTAGMSGLGFASVANGALKAGAGASGAGAGVVNYTQNIYTPVTSYGETKRAQREMGMTLAGRLV